MDTLNPGLARREREDLLMARKTYPAEFRRDAVELYRSTPNATVAGIAAGSRAPMASASMTPPRVWNLVRIPHRGPHPAGYHQWVLDNMLEADRVANGNVVEFKRLFTAWVVDVVKNDPSIVRHSYWNCEKYRD